MSGQRWRIDLEHVADVAGAPACAIAGGGQDDDAGDPDLPGRWLPDRHDRGAVPLRRAVEPDEDLHALALGDREALASQAPELAAVQRGEPGGDPLVCVLAQELPALEPRERAPDAAQPDDGDPLGGVGLLDLFEEPQQAGLVAVGRRRHALGDRPDVRDGVALGVDRADVVLAGAAIALDLRAVFLVEDLRFEAPELALAVRAGGRVDRDLDRPVADPALIVFVISVLTAAPPSAWRCSSSTKIAVGSLPSTDEPPLDSTLRPAERAKIPTSWSSSHSGSSRPPECSCGSHHAPSVPLRRRDS
jgi:hypothetical protein